MELDNWKQVGEDELRYKGYRRVDRRRYIDSVGKEVDFDLIVEGRTVCVLALTSDNRVILAKQFRPGPNKCLEEMPGGGLEAGEDPLNAIRRELVEETGYEGDLEFVSTSFHSAYSTLLRYNFVATNCRKVAEPHNPEGEYTEVVLKSLDEFKELLRSGELTDMGTGYRGLDYLNLL